MKRFNSFVCAALATLISVSFIFNTPTVSAETSDNSAALSIAPRKDYTIEPGKTINDTIVIRNIDQELPLDLNIRVIDFTSRDDTGTPQLMLDPEAPNTTWSLKPFLKIRDAENIKPGGTKTIDLSVTIPANQGAGSYYSAIVYSTSPMEGGNVGLGASGVTLVFVNVPGDVKQNLKLEKFGAYHANKRAYASHFTMNEPLNMAYELTNKGNVFESPTGSITLKHMFGREIVIGDINPIKNLVLIGQTRIFTPCIKIRAQDVDFNGAKSESKQCVSAGLWPGLYTAELNMFYGQNGNITEDITSKTWFWYLPTWFIVVFLIVLALVVYFVRKIVLKIRAKVYGTGFKKKPASSKSRRR